MQKDLSQSRRRTGLLLIFIPLVIFVILLLLRVFITMAIEPAMAASADAILALPGPPPEGMSPAPIVGQAVIFLLDYLLIMTTLMGIPCMIGGFVVWFMNRK
ncbi:MAG: hypothetical protein HOO67_00720 [Candidatus Peribacteraceae bacterium]|nr:hypothetical protein [Candidatus Peribacteraceae bacterium]